MSEQMGCPYETLGVDRGAGDDEIKKCYKKLAIQHHPDKNQGSVESTQMFQRISAAYAILSDPEKRSRYDRTGSLNEEDMAGPDMDHLMQMFFSQFGGGMMFGGGFGGGEVIFEMGGSRGGHTTYFQSDPFAQFTQFGGSDEDSDFEGLSADMFGNVFVDYDDDDEDDLMAQLMEVLPGLFCEHFIEEREVVEDPNAPPKPKGKKNRRKVVFVCKLCGHTCNTTEAAEDHFPSKHMSLIEVFIKQLNEVDIEEADIQAMFEDFAEDVRSGAIKERKLSARARRRRKAKGPFR